MELNTSQPQHSEIIAKPARKPVIAIIIGLLVIALAILGVLLWSSRQDITFVQDELKGLHDQLNVAKQSSTSAAKSDDAQIILATKAYMHGQTASAKSNIDVVVNKKVDIFARVGVTRDGATGSSCVLKQADNVWMVLYCTQSETETTKNLNQIFGVPHEVIKS